jgi:hypothetical protein
MSCMSCILFNKQRSIVMISIGPTILMLSASPEVSIAQPCRRISFDIQLCFAVMNSLVYFANVTLSSLYFDVRKDSLYADSINSLERRGVLTVLEKVHSSIF